MTESQKRAAERANQAKLLEAQLYVQNNLGRDLSLHAVSRAVGVSPSHFHRLFRSNVGETLKQYTDRLRVEKSLYDIRISSRSLLDISLRYGFRSPETYSRVFKRVLGRSPSSFLKSRAKKASIVQTRPLVENGLRRSRSGSFSITRLDDLHLAFIRHIGKYENVPLVTAHGENPWQELAESVEADLGTEGPRIYIGIPQDDPKTTSVNKLRFDMCVVVQGPVRPERRVGYTKIAAGYYGVLTHAGPYESLAGAYANLFECSLAAKGFRIASGAAFELMLDISATTIADHTWTELYLPMERGGPW